MPGRPIIFFATILLASCAQPKYEVIRSTSSTNSIDQGSKADCSFRFQQSSYCLTWAWEEIPTSMKPGALIFKVFRPNVFDHSPVMTDFSTAPRLVLWMPSMGHGSSPTEVNRLDTGTYRASNVFFIMPGEWDLRFLAQDSSGDQDEVIVPIVFN